jgi:hypothetical protein
MNLKEVGSKVIRCRFEVIRSLPETSNTVQEVKMVVDVNDRNAHVLFSNWCPCSQLFFQNVYLIKERHVVSFTPLVVVDVKNLIQQQHQVRMSEKFVGADTGKQLQRVINPVGLWVFLEVLVRVKININPG